MRQRYGLVAAVFKLAIADGWSVTDLTLYQVMSGTALLWLALGMTRIGKRGSSLVKYLAIMAYAYCHRSHWVCRLRPCFTMSLIALRRFFGNRLAFSVYVDYDSARKHSQARVAHAARVDSHCLYHDRDRTGCRSTGAGHQPSGWMGSAARSSVGRYIQLVLLPVRVSARNEWIPSPSLRSCRPHPLRSSCCCMLPQH